MSFFDINYDIYNDGTNFEFSDKIVLLKRVKSLRQLRRTEKELVRLNYKEAIIKGFTLKGIQQYIASKTKIWIEWSCLEYLKKTEEQENKEWYMRLAKDHFSYIGIHREALDEIQQLKNELWKIIMNSKSENSVKIAAVKEVHNLVKTKCLLLRDLPFIT
jgi:FMN phosphatase YigB (HAD superfamily)